MCRATITEAKKLERQRHAEAVARHLAQGGSIRQCPPFAYARGADRLSDREESRRQRAAKVASEAATVARRASC